MINILSYAQKLTPGYNPIYTYALSDQLLRDKFTYRTFLALPDSNDDIISIRTILPRIGDSLFENDNAKILQSKLGNITDDVNINTNDDVFNNTPASGLRYILGVQERYLNQWEFTSASYSTFFDDQIVLYSDVPSPFTTGDTVIVNGLSTVYTYNGIVAGPNNYARLNMTSPHTLQTGDFVFIKQQSPMCFTFYNGFVEVLISDPNYIVINKLWSGACTLTQTGTVTSNPELDGTAVVVFSGGTFPTYETMINKTGTASIVGTYSGSVIFTDSRETFGDVKLSRPLSVFNGAVAHNQWPIFDYEDYVPTVNGFEFLTDLPQGWVIRPENDCYLNYWTGNLEQIWSNLYLTTYDTSGVTAGPFQIVNMAGTPSTIQSVNVGPAVLGECVTVEAVPSELGIFATSTGWTLTSIGNATGSISGTGSDGTLNYNFTGIGGVGRVNAVIPTILTVGENYNITLDVALNQDCEIQIGGSGLGTFVTQSQAGVFTGSFTASSVNLTIRIDGLVSTPACTINSVSVTYEACGLVDCNTKSYDVYVGHRIVDTASVVYPFSYGDAGWILSATGNARGFFASGGRLVYADLVEFGGVGLLAAVQEDCMSIGGNYQFRFEVLNNSECEVFVGPSGNVVSVVPVNTTGTFVGTFVATSEDFAIVINGQDAVFTNGCEIRNITVIRTDEFVAYSEVRNFLNDCSCTGRYDNKAMLFLDRMGSLVPYNWTVNHTEKVLIKPTGFKKNIGNYVPGSNNGHSYNIQDSSYTQFSTEIMEEWELNSDWLTEEQSLFLEQLKTSPVVYIDNGGYVPVRVKDITYDRTFKRNKKMIAHKMNIIFNNENNIQQG